EAIDTRRATHRRDCCFDESLCFVRRVRSSRRLTGFVSGFKIFLGSSLESLLAVRRTKYVNAALMNCVQIGIAGDGRAHSCARAFELNLVAGRVLLKSSLGLGVREQVLKRAASNGDLQVALNFFPLHEHHWIKTFENRHNISRG